MTKVGLAGSDQTEAVNRIRHTVAPILRTYASRISLYGSFARGEQSDESDVDLLIRLRPPDERPGLGLGWFALERELEARLGRPVEMASEDGVNQRLRAEIEPDLVVLYEE